MVGFSLTEIMGGERIDTAETRETRLRIAFEMLLAAVLDVRFDDARDHLSEIGAEIDDLDALLKRHGLTPESGLDEDPPAGPSERGDHG